MSKNERCEVYESNCSSTSYPCATGSLEAGTAKLKMLINAREHTSDVLSNLIGPFKKSRSGNRYIITLVDYFSKWPEAAAIPSKEANEVAFFLFKMICRYI